MARTNILTRALSGLLAASIAFTVPAAMTVAGPAAAASPKTWFGLRGRPDRDPSAVARYKTPVMNVAAPGVPVDDFPVGRTSTAPMSIAIISSKPILGISSTSRTIPTKGGSVSFVIDPKAYPGVFFPGSSVSFTSTASIAAGSPAYVNGTVEAYDPITHELAIRTVPTGSYGIGGVGVGTALATISTAGAGPYSDWQLNLNLPPNWNGGPSNVAKGIVAITGPAAPQAIANWDFRQMHAGFYEVTASTNSIDFSQCLFDQANLPIGYMAGPFYVWGAANSSQAYFSFLASQPWTLTNSEVAWNWRRYAATVHVVSVDSVVNDATLVTVDAIPPLADDYRLASQDVGTTIDGNRNWRVIDATNPAAMRGTVLKAINGTQLTLSNYLVDPAQSQVAGSSDRKASGTTDLGTAVVLDASGKPLVKPGDTLQLFPRVFSGILATGSPTNFQNNLVDVENDMFITSPSQGVPVVVKGNVINMLGVHDGLHSDVWQEYVWDGGDFLFSNNVVDWGTKAGDATSGRAGDPVLPNISVNMRWGNPRDMQIIERNTAVMGKVLWHDNLVLAPPDGPSGYLFYFTSRSAMPVAGVRQNAAGQARVSIDTSLIYNGKGGGFRTGDIWRVGGSPVAGLSGGLPIVAEGGNNGNANLSYVTSGPASNGTNTIPFSTTVAAGLSKGQLLYSGSTLLGGVLSMGSDGTVTLDGNLPIDVAQGATLTTKLWLDFAVPYPSTIYAPSSTTTSPGWAAGNDTIQVADSSAMLTGALVRSSGGGLLADTFVKQAVDATHVQLSSKVTGAVASTTTLTISTSLEATTVGLNRISNNYFRNLSQIGSGSNPTDSILTFSSAGWYNGVSIEGIYDADTGAALTFRAVPPTSLTGAVPGWSAYYPKLPAPSSAPTVTKASGGSITIGFPTVDGAAGYAYTLNGGTTWSDDPVNGGTIQPSATISSLSAGTYVVGVRAMNCPNDLGNLVNPGDASTFTSFVLN